MKLIKLREGYSNRYLLKMIRRSILASFALGVALGLSLAFIKVAELKGKAIELYEVVLVPCLLLAFFILVLLYAIRLIIPELERRLNEKK